MQRVAAGDFVEHAEYAGNRYGTLRSELERPGRGIVLEIEVQGARQVRETLPDAVQSSSSRPRSTTLEAAPGGAGVRPTSRSRAGWRSRGRAGGPGGVRARSW